MLERPWVLVGVTQIVISGYEDFSLSSNVSIAIIFIELLISFINPSQVEERSFTIAIFLKNGSPCK